MGYYAMLFPSYWLLKAEAASESSFNWLSRQMKVKKDGARSG